MSMEGLRAVTDPAVGAWLAPRLGGAFGAVSRTAPGGFPAYARVLHPVDSAAGGPTTWAQVCARTGRTAHALMQWRAITTPAAGVELHLSGGRWSDVGSRRGEFDAPALQALLDVLAPFTGDQDCVHTLWEGWGWLHPGASETITAMPIGQPAPAPSPSPEPETLRRALESPRLRLPCRDHLLLQGPLGAATRVGHQVTRGWFSAQSPNLLWPVDQSWCVASEIDFDSTLVAGSAELIAAVLAAPGLEAWPVSEEDDLSWHGDTVNR